VRIDDPACLSAREVALMMRLKLLTYRPTLFPHLGDFMSDDTTSSLRLITPPASEPISLASAKLFLRIEHTAEDETITRAIAAARTAAEQHLRMLLLPQTWEYSIANPGTAMLYLPNGPAQSITSITLTNEAGATSTMNTNNYRLSVDGRAVMFTNAPAIEKLTVSYVAGWVSAASEIPAQVMQGMLHHISVLMETRDGAAPMPVQTLASYQPYRRVSL
jgi:uncharacterized phiE125 gp8 family phage protein